MVQNRLVRKKLGPGPNNFRTFSDRSVTEPGGTFIPDLKSKIWIKIIFVRSSSRWKFQFILIWFILRLIFWEFSTKIQVERSKSRFEWLLRSPCWGRTRVEDEHGFISRSNVYDHDENRSYCTNRTHFTNFEIFILGFPVTNDHSTYWDVHVTSYRLNL